LKGYYKKIGGALVPDDDATVDQLQKLKTGEVYSVDLKRPRNVKFNRKFQALVDLVYDNQDKYHNREALLTELKIQVGHYEEHITLGGKLVLQPKSISFASMDEDEFSIFYSKVIDVVLRFFLKNMDEDELNSMIESVLGFV
jgi:hypothetical protein